MAKKLESVNTFIRGDQMNRFVKLFSDGSTEDRSTGEVFPPPSDKYKLAELQATYYRTLSRMIRKDFEEAKRRGVNGHPTEDDIGQLESLRARYVNLREEAEKQEQILQDEPGRARRKFAEEQKEKLEAERKERVERIKGIKLPDETDSGNTGTA